MSLVSIGEFARLSRLSPKALRRITMRCAAQRAGMRA